MVLFREQPLGIVQTVTYKLVGVVLDKLGFWPRSTGQVQVLVEENKTFESQMADVGIDQVLDEDLTFAFLPLFDHQVDVMGVDFNVPALEYLGEF